MGMKELSPGQVGTLNGVLGAALVFSVGIAAAAFFLKRKHEAELDKLERDTAALCLDAAADYYESVFRKRQKASGKHTPTEDDWAALEKEIKAQQTEFEVLKQNVAAQIAEAGAALDRAKSNLPAEAAAPAAGK